MVKYLITGYEETKIPETLTPYEAIQEWFTKHDHLKLRPEQIFKQTQGNITVYVYRYYTLYTETFIVEEREF